jgi:hypothetical protein
MRGSTGPACACRASLPRACIGIVTEHDIGRALDALADTLREMGVQNLGRPE